MKKIKKINIRMIRCIIYGHNWIYRGWMRTCYYCEKKEKFYSEKRFREFLENNK